MNNINIVEALSQIAREKNVDRRLVIETLTDALVSAAKKRFVNADNFEVQLDADTGHMAVLARKTVVEEVNEPELEIDLEDARQIDKQAQLGSVVFEELNLSDFGRNAIQAAKQILIQRVREAERDRIYDEFSGRLTQIESGIVQQISHGDIVMNLGRAEAAIPLKEQIRRERYRQGDSVRGYIYEVLKSTRGPQVLLSRTHPEFLRKLFSIEVPEIAEGIVKIHSVAREPGERAKIAVSSNDERVDPVGACVGVKGSRVQAIVRELSGERIDIVPWIDEPQIFIGRALSPAAISRVIVDERRQRASVIVGSDQLSLAIGKSGQNSRLAVQLTGWGLDILTEEEFQARRRRIEESQQELRKLEGVSELIAISLASSGFISIRAIAEVEVNLLQTVPGLEGEEGVLAARLKEKAEKYVSEAEGRGEELRPATIQELEAMEASAAKEETAKAAAEASEMHPDRGDSGGDGMLPETADETELPDSPVDDEGSQAVGVPADTSVSSAGTEVSEVDAPVADAVPSNVIRSGESGDVNEKMTDETSD